MNRLVNFFTPLQNGVEKQPSFIIRALMKIIKVGLTNSQMAVWLVASRFRTAKLLINGELPKTITTNLIVETL